MLSRQPLTFSEALPKPKGTLAREATVCAVGLGTVDVQPVGSGSVMRNLPLIGDNVPSVGDRVLIQFSGGRRVVFAAAKTDTISSDETSSSTSPIAYGEDMSSVLAWQAAHIAAPDPHPSYLSQSEGDLLYVPLSRTLTAGAGLSGGGTLSSDRTFDVNVGNGIQITTDAVAIKLKTTSGLEVDSTGLALADTVAGNGLGITSKVLAVNVGNGIQITSDAVAISLRTASGLVVDGTGLALGTPSTLTVGTTNAVTTSAHTHAITSSSSPGAAASLLASDASGILTLVQLTATTRLRSPILDTASGDLTLSPATANTAASRITLSDRLRAPIIDTASGDLALSPASGITTASQLTASTKVRTPLLDTATGDLTLSPATANTAASRITLSDRLRTPVIDTASGSVTLSPAQDIIVNSGGSGVRLMTGNAVFSDGYQSQEAGMAITHAGGADFRYLFTDELHAKSFIADLEQALAGGQIIAKSVAVLHAAFTIPAPGGEGYFYVRDLPSAAGMRVFEDRDMIRFRSFTRDAGSLDISDAWGEVYYSPLFGFNLYPGTQRYKFVRRTGVTIDDTTNDPILDTTSDPILANNVTTPEGGMAGGTPIYADSIVLDYGKNQSGIHEINAIDGIYGLNSPYAQTVSWVLHPKNATVRTRIGNLRGVFGVADEYGFYAGSGTANADQYVRVSTNGVRLNNVPLALYSNNSQRVNIDSSGTNVWLSSDGGTTKQLGWDGSTLSIIGSITVTGGNAATNSYVDTGLAGKISNSGAAADVNANTTTISGGKIRTGSIQSTNWGTSAGTLLNLDDGAIQIGGSSSPKFSWNGTSLALRDSAIQLFSSGSQRVNIDSTGTNVWFSSNGGTTKQLSWDGSTLNVVGNITINGGSGWSNLTGLSTAVTTAGTTAVWSSVSDIPGIGSNLLSNPTFEEMKGWTTNFSNSASPTATSATSGVNYGTQWQLPGINTVWLYVAGGVGSANYIEYLSPITDIQVAAGEKIEWSVYAHPRRSKVDTYLKFYDATGAFVAFGTDTNASYEGAQLAAASNLTYYTRLWGITTVPANAAYVRLALRNFAASVNTFAYTDSRGFFVLPYVGRAQVNQTQPSPWSNNGTRGMFTSPAGDGLYLSSDYMGFYKSSQWRTYIDSAGKFMLVASSGTHGLDWNPTTNTLTITGAINVTSAGTVNGVAATDVSSGATRANTAINSGNVIIAKVVPTTAAAPTGSGLHLGSDYMGFYSGSAWRTYMDSSGNFLFRASPNASANVGALRWTASAGILEGGYYAPSGGLNYNGAFTTQWYTDSGTGAIVAGGGKVTLNANGIFATDGSKPTFTTVTAATLSVNDETLAVGDTMLGDNTTNKPNIFFDQDAGQLKFRGGKTTQAIVDASGALVSGTNPPYSRYASNGITFVLGTGSLASFAQNAIVWSDNDSRSVPYASLKVTRVGTTTITTFLDLTVSTGTVTLTGGADTITLGSAINGALAISAPGSRVLHLSGQSGIKLLDATQVTAALKVDTTIEAGGSGNKWTLGGYSSNSATATGHVVITITSATGTTTYKLLAST